MLPIKTASDGHLFCHEEMPDGFLQIEGDWYCPSIPEPLQEATRDYRNHVIDEDTYHQRLAEPGRMWRGPRASLTPRALDSRRAGEGPGGRVLGEPLQGGFAPPSARIQRRVSHDLGFVDVPSFVDTPWCGGRGGT